MKTITERFNDELKLAVKLSKRDIEEEMEANPRFRDFINNQRAKRKCQKQKQN